MDKTAYLNVSIIDVINKKILDNHYLVVENEKIINIGKMSDYKKNSDEINEIDGMGRYLSPGLIDAHVHLVWDGNEDPQNVIHYLEDSAVTLRAYKNALETLKLGVTTVRDVASPGKTVLHVRDAIEQNLLIGPTIIASGRAVCMTGGHVHYIGVEADGKDNVRKTTRELLKEGVDVIKVMATGGIYTFGEEPGSPQLNKDEIKAAVEEAHNKNKKVAAHAEGLIGIHNCLDVGVDTIEHGIFADEEALKRMVELGTFLVPTMIVMKRLAVDERIAPWALEKAKEVVEPHQWMLEKAIELGVKIATGTDCGSPVTPPIYYFDELEIMNSAGMSPFDVVLSSTIIGAKCLDIEHTHGSIEEGKYADFLLLKENPVENISAFRDIDIVVKKGKIIN